MDMCTHAHYVPYTQSYSAGLILQLGDHPQKPQKLDLSKISHYMVLLMCIFFLSSSGKLSIVTPSGKIAAMNKSSCFKMALWLAIYNEFFVKKVS